MLIDEMATQITESTEGPTEDAAGVATLMSHLGIVMRKAPLISLFSVSSVANS
jgi:hypothetical protein